MAPLHQVPRQALLLERRTSHHLHVLIARLLRLRPPPKPLRDLPHHSHYTFHHRPFDHVLVRHPFPFLLSAALLTNPTSHVAIFIDGEWTIFIYPCLVLWILDRALRALRILSFNPQFWNTKATATYSASCNLVRLEVPFTQTRLQQPKPGTYYYIYDLSNPLYAHQNHPFTLAFVTSGRGRATEQGTTANTNADAAAIPLRRPSSSSSSFTGNSDDSASTEADALLSPSPSSSSPGRTPALIFLIRPYSGFTSRLAKLAATHTHAHAPSSLRILLEGPYGPSAPLHHYPHILFIVGGTGIAVPLSHLTHLLSSSSVASLRIVWAVREHAFLAAVVDEFARVLEDERVVLDAHVTRDEEGKDEALDEGEGVRGVRVEAGRPDVGAVVEDAAREAGCERLAVVACGPAQMADQARRACVGVLGRGYRGVEYFEESFKW